MVNTQDFSVFVPIDKIEKAKDKEGNEVWKIGGIASNANTGPDSDGETIDVNGMDLTKFLKSGFINYNHLSGKDPSAIIGEPVKAEVKDGKLHVEAILYPEVEMARHVYDLANALKKSSSSRKLGYSIEGKAIKRDGINPKLVQKSEITGLAVTPSPKCKGTEVIVIKGNDWEFETQEGSEYLIDVIGDDGARYQVDRDLNIIKSEGAPGYGGRSGSTSSAEDMDRVTQKESVEGAKKKKKKSEETQQDNKKFSKGETYNKIFSMFNLSVEDAHSLYNLIEEVQKVLTPNMEKTQITPEAILKAQQILGLVKSEGAATANADEAAKKAAEDLKKAEDAKIQKELEETLKKAEELKAKLGGSATTATTTTTQQSATKTEDLNKSESQSVNDTLIKSFQEQFSALGTLISSKDNDVAAIKQENAELKKSIEDISAFNARLAERLGMIEKQPMDRKSISTAKYIERFSKGEENSEGVKDDASAAGMKTLSLSNKVHRSELAGILLKAATKDPNKLDDELAKSVQTVELGSLAPTQAGAVRVHARLKNEFKINVVA